MSRRDISLVRYYLPQEAQQINDAVYARAPAAQGMASLHSGGLAQPMQPGGRSTAIFSAPTCPLVPGFQYSDVLPYANQRLVVADLTPLHAAHRLEDLERPADELSALRTPRQAL